MGMVLVDVGGRVALPVADDAWLLVVVAEVVVTAVDVLEVPEATLLELAVEAGVVSAVVVGL